MTLLTLVIVLLLYILAPNSYSLPYCILLEAIYLYAAIITWKKDTKMDFPGFHLIFSMSFFCVTYLYPTLVYPIVPDFSLFQFLHYSDSIITKCTALATFAYCLYCYGYTVQVKNTRNTIDTACNQIVCPSKKIYNWTIIAFVLFILLGGLNYYAKMYSNGTADNVSSLVKYIVTFYPSFLLILCVVYRTGSTNDKNEKKILLSVLLMSALIMTSGSRTIPLLAMTMFGYVFIEKHTINKMYVTLLLAVGFACMVMVGEMRAEGTYISDGSDVGRLGMFTDLIVCTRNLYAAYDIVCTEGFTYGETLLADFLSPIPMLQSFISDIFSIPGDFMGSAGFLTYKEFGFGSRLGLGTHIVADIYLCGGLLSLLLFYYLGKFVVKAREKMRSGNILWSIVYIGFVGNAIYYARSSFFGNTRLLLWAILIFYLLYKSQYLQTVKQNRLNKIN